MESCGTRAKCAHSTVHSRLRVQNLPSHRDQGGEGAELTELMSLTPEEAPCGGGALAPPQHHHPLRWLGCDLLTQVRRLHRPGGTLSCAHQVLAPRGTLTICFG